MVEEDRWARTSSPRWRRPPGALQEVAVGLLNDDVRHRVVDAAARGSDVEVRARLVEMAATIRQWCGYDPPPTLSRPVAAPALHGSRVEILAGVLPLTRDGPGVSLRTAHCLALQAGGITRSYRRGVPPQPGSGRVAGVHVQLCAGEIVGGARGSRKSTLGQRLPGFGCRLTSLGPSRSRSAPAQNSRRLPACRPLTENYVPAPLVA